MIASVLSRVTPAVRRMQLLLSVAAAAIVVDQISKRLVEAGMELYQNIPIIGHWFGLTRTTNTGAAFSLFQNGGMVFIVIAAVVTAAIFYYAPRLPDSDRASRIALGLQLGGALGNVIDRVRQGYVTDFLHLRIPEIGFDWPVSNIADICIVGGVIFLIVQSLRGKGALAD